MTIFLSFHFRFMFTRFNYASLIATTLCEVEGFREEQKTLWITWRSGIQPSGHFRQICSASHGFGPTVDRAKLSCYRHSQGHDPRGETFPLPIIQGFPKGTTPFNSSSSSSYILKIYFSYLSFQKLTKHFWPFNFAIFFLYYNIQNSEKNHHFLDKISQFEAKLEHINFANFFSYRISCPKKRIRDFWTFAHWGEIKILVWFFNWRHLSQCNAKRNLWQIFKFSIFVRAVLRFHIADIFESSILTKFTIFQNIISSNIHRNFLTFCTLFLARNLKFF